MGDTYDPAILALMRRQMRREAEASVALDPGGHEGIHTCDGSCGESTSLEGE